MLATMHWTFGPTKSVAAMRHTWTMAETGTPYGTTVRLAASDSFVRMMPTLMLPGNWCDAKQWATAKKWPGGLDAEYDLIVKSPASADMHDCERDATGKGDAPAW